MTDGRVYVIAEIGINHNGSYENCIKMVDAAAEAGCDAVKLQFFRAKNLYPKSAGELDWKDSKGEYSYSIYGAVKGFEFPDSWIDELLWYCRSKEIELLSSASDPYGVDILLSKGLRKIKLTSYTITNTVLIEHCAKTGVPIIMSTGGATIGEIEAAIEIVTKYHNKLSLLHCSIQYPTALSDCNLGVIKTLQYAFPGFPVGYSDHTMEAIEAPVQAVYLGARIIEKHITLDKAMDGPDHFFALEPYELMAMVAAIRQAESDYERGTFSIDKVIYGSTAKTVYQHEKYLRDFAFMKLFANRDIQQGQSIGAEDISILRPGKKRHGLDPVYLKLFEEFDIKAKKLISFEDPITWDLIF
ncbi:N-acetylneuraminate synthase family protein [Candidatus Magnetominusculus dajiuhuensis]|uniref:N-acetylneuraminate synthase family protein n=1 Tax=Candidatus Magnetominusculus dajiuhuensis TaxID=3137712 RepID=UPI003B435006